MDLHKYMQWLRMSLSAPFMNVQRAARLERRCTAAYFYLNQQFLISLQCTEGHVDEKILSNLCLTQVDQSKSFKLPFIKSNHYYVLLL